MRQNRIVAILAMLSITVGGACSKEKTEPAVEPSSPAATSTGGATLRTTPVTVIVKLGGLASLWDGPPRTFIVPNLAASAHKHEAVLVVEEKYLDSTSLPATNKRCTNKTSNGTTVCAYFFPLSGQRILVEKSSGFSAGNTTLVLNETGDPAEECPNGSVSSNSLHWVPRMSLLHAGMTTTIKNAYTTPNPNPSVVAAILPMANGKSLTATVQGQRKWIFKNAKGVTKQQVIADNIEYVYAIDFDSAARTYDLQAETMGSSGPVMSTLQKFVPDGTRIVFWLVNLSDQDKFLAAIHNLGTPVSEGLAFPHFDSFYDNVDISGLTADDKFKATAGKLCSSTSPNGSGLDCGPDRVP